MTARILIATDLDRTLLPNGAQPESPGAREWFAAIAARPEVLLAYVSGRHQGLVREAIAEYGLPAPDYVIGDVGTRLYRVDGDGWHLDQDWSAEIGRDWSGVAELISALEPVAAIRLQEAERQNDCKLSYYGPGLADATVLLAEVRACLVPLGVAYNLIWSVDETRGVGLLDVLPAQASKLHALEFLIRQLGLANRDALFAGDSGNDLEALVGPVPAVLVANADDSVRRQAVEKARANGHADLLYLARGGWQGLNGNYSAGILEGLAHFHPQTTAFLSPPPSRGRGRGEGAASVARQDEPASPATPAPPSPRPSPLKGEGENQPRPLIFGEVLFDRFPDGSEVLGGAPFNVAWHLQGFGAAPLFVSRVGADAAGERVRAAMRAWGMDTAGLQTDPIHATGAVEIELNQGEPSYRIDPDQAYGHIEPAALTAAPALLYHGSLALWGNTSRQALDALLRRHDVPIFLDVNLRAPWWREADVLAWIDRAAWVKLNGDELARLEGGEGDPADQARRMCRSRKLSRVVVTQGSDGAFAVDDRGVQDQVRPVALTRVVDTVGAGDAFASVLILGLLRGWGLAATLSRAQAFASAIVGVRGATVADTGFYRRFLAEWGHE